MLLVSRSGLVEEDVVEVFSLVLFFLHVKFSFTKNNNMVLFPFPFHHLHAVGQIVVNQSSRIVSHPKDKKLPRPLPSHPPSGKAVGSL